MNIAFRVPIWAIWLIGVPLVAAVLGFAFVGWYAARSFGGGNV
jgi:hypothetical protein